MIPNAPMCPITSLPEQGALGSHLCQGCSAAIYPPGYKQQTTEPASGRWAEMPLKATKNLKRTSLTVS